MNKRCIFLWMMVLLCGSAYAQKAELTDEQVKNGVKGVTVPLEQISGWMDKTHYLMSRPGESEKYAVDISSGKATLYTPEVQKGKKPSVEMKDDDIYYKAGTEQKRLTQTDAVEKNPQLSPDGKWVAFTRDNNLYALNIENGKEVQYTSDGTDLILNGWASWVYYEEILGRASRYRAFWWSPDSKKIAFFRSDDSKVPMFPIYNSEGQHGYLEQTRYPKAGDNNPEVKIGMVNVEGGDVIWADFNEKDDQYFGAPFWRDDSRTLWVQWLNRDQNNLKIYELNPDTGTKKELYDEKQPTWIDWISDIYFVKDGFMIVRDMDGWEQIYFHNPDGSLKNKVTNGKMWGTRIVKIDEASKTVYFTSRGEISTRTDFYSASFDGKKQQRLTFGDYSHGSILLSPDNRYFITSYSNVSTPTQIALVDVKNGKVKKLADSKGPDFDKYNLAMPEMVWLKTNDGFDLPARVTWPVNRVPGKKYPVLISVYGGPNAGTVSDGWRDVSRGQKDAKDGLIQISIDHRGSGHCGKKGLNYLHRNLGKWEMADYIEWVKFLREKPFVDPERIAITGGSYGGYITALALTYGADYFNYGIANFGVMDWALYDSHYTERYMDRPQDNSEGYKAGSVMTYADKYKGGEKAMLRIVHGTMDDNVHMQNSIQLVDELQELNKDFEFMLYPGKRHGWGGNKAKHQSMETKQFIDKYLLRKEE